jgi:hypothetical protein
VAAPNRSLANPNTRNVRVGIIVKSDRQGGWKDGLGRDFKDAVEFELPDNDVFVIDAMANPPVEKAAFQHAGTLNFSLAAHPSNGKVYLATIEAINLNRFLSVPRLDAFPNPNPTGGTARTADPASGKTLNGHLYESRVAILSPGGKVDVRHLNKHIDYEVVPSPPGVKERSVANPQGLTFSPTARRSSWSVWAPTPSCPSRRASSTTTASSRTPTRTSPSPGRAVRPTWCCCPATRT